MWISMKKWKSDYESKWIKKTNFRKVRYILGTFSGFFELVINFYYLFLAQDIFLRIF